MFPDVPVHPASIDKKTSTPDQLAKLTRRMEELEYLHSNDVNKLNARVNELNARVNELSKLRENDAHVISGLNDHIKELERLHVEDLYVKTMLTKRVGEMERQYEHIIFNTIKDLPVPPQGGAESDNTSYKYVTSPTTHVVQQAPEHSTSKKENASSTINKRSSNTTERSGRIQSRYHRKITRVSPSEDVLAFHVVLTNQITNPATNSPVIYNHPITNSGGALYSTNSGMFTCTQPGVHVFSWAIYVSPHHYIDSDLVRNNAVIGSSETGQPTSYGSAASATAAVHLDAGDEVWVRVAGHASGSNILPTRSMFTGFRLG